MELEEGVKTCIDNDGCYKTGECCGLSGDKKEVPCEYLEKGRVGKEKFYEAGKRMVETECYGCGYKKRLPG